MVKYHRIVPIGQFSSPAEEEPFIITLASLGIGSARQSDMIENYEDYPAVWISVLIKSGTAPSAGRVYKVYLLRDTGNVADDNAGGSDAAITIENAPLLGVIGVTNTANKNFYGIFYTGTKDIGPLGHRWGIAIKNDTDQALNASGHYAGYTYAIPSTDE